MSSPARRAFAWLHAHPEVSGQEERTAAYSAQWFRDLGWSVRARVGGHGVVATLRNGPGRHVALRAELDALPHRDADGAAVVRHSCGHDLHLAGLLAAAAGLTADRQSWQGTLTAICQPSEETLQGARAMLADDLYADGVPEVLLAQHTAPFPAGLVAHAPGPVLAGARVLDVCVRGQGGHAAGTGRTSPLVTAAAIIGRLQTVVASETGPAEPAVLNVGAVDAPEPPGVVPDQVGFQVSLRAMNTDGLDRLELAARRVICAEAVASGHGREPVVTTVARSLPVTNETELVQTIAAAHRAALGSRSVLRWVPSMATEDFPALTQPSPQSRIRSCYWMLGSVDPAAWAAVPGDFASKLASIPGNHHPEFVAHPGAVDAAPVVMTAAVRAALAIPAGGGKTCRRDGEGSPAGVPASDPSAPVLAVSGSLPR